MTQAYRFNLSTRALIITLFTFIAIWMVWPQEFIASDPLNYSRIAHSINETGSFGGNQIFAQRVAVTLPTALFYKVFGVSIRTTNLVSLLSCLLLICTVWLSLPDSKSKVIGMALCATSIPLFKASIALYPDIIATAHMAFSFYMLQLRKKVFLNNTNIFSICIAVTAIGSLFIAFLAKLSAYWVLPLWILAFATDLKSKDRGALIKRFYLPVLLTGLCLFVGYLIFCSIVWSDPFSRLNAVQSLTGKHLWSLDNAPIQAIIKRLVVAPIPFLIKQFGIPILSLAFLSYFLAPRSVRNWSYYAICILLFFWFGPTNFTKYQPLPLANRMILPLLPALIILTAYLTSRFVVLFSHPQKINSWIPITFVILLTVIPFARYIKNGWLKELPEAHAMAIVQRELRQNPKKEILLLCSDVRSPNSLAFYFGYRYPDNLRVSYFGKLNQYPQLDDIVLVFLDRDRSDFLKEAYGLANYDAKINTFVSEPLYHSSNVKLVKISNRKQIRAIIKSNRLVH